MTGNDSSDDRSPGNIALLALAAFSTSYNLPVYLHYNTTFRRAYLRMLRCQSSLGQNTGQLFVVRSGIASAIPRDAPTRSRSSNRQDLASGGEPQREPSAKPSTSHDYRNKLAVPQPPAVLWSRPPNTEQLESYDSFVVIERY